MRHDAQIAATFFTMIMLKKRRKANILKQHNQSSIKLCWPQIVMVVYGYSFFYRIRQQAASHQLDSSDNSLRFRRSSRNKRNPLTNLDTSELIALELSLSQSGNCVSDSIRSYVSIFASFIHIVLLEIVRF